MNAFDASRYAFRDLTSCKRCCSTKSWRLRGFLFDSCQIFEKISLNIQRHVFYYDTMLRKTMIKNLVFYMKSLLIAAMSDDIIIQSPSHNYYHTDTNTDYQYK